MFMMKNIFNILVTLRTLHPELVNYLNRDDKPTVTNEVDAAYIPHYETKTKADGQQSRELMDINWIEWNWKKTTRCPQIIES